MDGPTTVNVVLLGILVVATVTGFTKGLIRQVLALVGLVASFFVAILLSGALADLLSEQTSMPYSPSLVISFLLIFIGGIIGFHFLAVVLQKVVKMIFLGWVDRLCGGMLGLIIGLFITSLGVCVLLELPVSSKVRGPVEQSTVSMFVRPVAPVLFNMVFSHGKHGIDFESIFRRGGVV